MRSYRTVRAAPAAAAKSLQSCPTLCDQSHQHEAQDVHSASVCSKVKIAISFYLSQACQQESTSKEQEQNEKLNVI